MIILKHGNIPVVKYQGQCKKCGAIVEVIPTELGLYNEVSCPTCLEDI